MNPMMNMMLTMLQTKNPQGFQMVNKMMQSGGNPQDLLKQIVGKADNNQIQQVLQQAKGMGVPENILSQIQNFNS